MWFILTWSLALRVSSSYSVAEFRCDIGWRVDQTEIKGATIHGHGFHLVRVNDIGTFTYPEELHETLPDIEPADDGRGFNVAKGLE